MTKKDKVSKVMHEWKLGTLTSNGRKVTDYDQAVAIALSEAGLSKYEKGGDFKSRAEFIKEVKKMHESIDEIILKDGTKIKGKELMKKGGEIINLKPLTLVPLSTQLNRATGYNWNSLDWTNEDGSEARANEGNVIVNVHTKQKFRIPKRYLTYVDGYSVFIDRDSNTIRTFPENLEVAKIVNDKLDFNNENKLYVDKSKFSKEFELGLIPFGNLKEIEEVHEIYAKGGSISNLSTNERKKLLIDEVISKHNWSRKPLTENSGVVKTMADKYDLGVVTVAALFNEHSKKYEVGGEIGNEVSFKSYGETRRGLITDKVRNNFEVVTDSGTVLVEPSEVIEFHEPTAAKKKRFGFFEKGGSIEEYKQAERDYDRYGEYLEDAIEEGNESDIKKYKKLMDEAESKMHKYERGEEYAKGGEIKAEIEKLQFVVNSKTLPESVKEQARKTIAKLEKELDESNENKSEEKEYYSRKNYSTENWNKIKSFLSEKYSENSVDEILGSKIMRFVEPKSYNSFLKYYKKYPEHFEEFETKSKEKSEHEITLEKLYSISNKAEDLINYQHGGIQSQPIDKIKKYVEYINKEVSKLDVPFGGEIYDSLEDDNYHSLNLTLGLLGFYKNEKDNGDWAKSQDSYKNLVEVVNEVKGGSKKEVKGDLPKPKGRPSKKGDKKAVNNQKTSKDYKDNYMMLDRLKQDNDYFLGNGNRSESGLWAGNVKGQISEMKKLWNELPKDKKPDWLSMKDIEDYESKMLKTPKQKVDRKKLVEKAKAKKKGITDFNNKASLNPKTGERRKRNESVDKKRDALPLGKRISKNGKIYYENRLNHGDFDKGDKFEKGGEVKSSGFGLDFLKW